MWLRNFISGLVIMDTIAKPLKIFCNNSAAAVYFSLNTGSSSRSEHIDIKYLFVREKVVESHICVVHTPTEHMLADLLTKGLSPRACDSYGFIRVLCSIELVGVMCGFVYCEYSFCVVMYCCARICMNYDIGVVIQDIVYESRLASNEYVVITIVLFVFYTCILCLDHVIVNACCMLCIISMYYNLSLANTFGSDGVLKCIFACFFFFFFFFLFK